MRSRPCHQIWLALSAASALGGARGLLRHGGPAASGATGRSGGKGVPADLVRKGPPPEGEDPPGGAEPPSRPELLLIGLLGMPFAAIGWMRQQRQWRRLQGRRAG